MHPDLSLAGSRLPPHSRVIESRRDYLVVRISCFQLAHQFGVLWDPARDELVLSVMSALSYRNMRARNYTLALAMLRGKLTVYYSGDAEHLAWGRKEIQDAADSVLVPIGQKWEVLPLVPVEMTTGAHGNRIMDRSKLAADHPLLVIPAAYQLGAVMP